MKGISIPYLKAEENRKTVSDYKSPVDSSKASKITDGIEEEETTSGGRKIKKTSGSKKI